MINTGSKGVPAPSLDNQGIKRISMLVKLQRAEFEGSIRESGAKTLGIPDLLTSFDAVQQLHGCFREDMRACGEGAERTSADHTGVTAASEQNTRNSIIFSKHSMYNPPPSGACLPLHLPVMRQHHAPYTIPVPRGALDAKHTDPVPKQAPTRPRIAATPQRRESG